MISSLSVNIDLFHYYLYLVKYLKGYLITSTDILMNIICLILNSQGLDQMIHAFYHLMEIIHKTFSSFDRNATLEISSVFLNISKAVDKVWNMGLLFKLESMGISGNLLNLMESFLSKRFQRVLLNGQ